jgi:hypothetical protein
MLDPLGSLVLMPLVPAPFPALQLLSGTVRNLLTCFLVILIPVFPKLPSPEGPCHECIARTIAGVAWPSAGNDTKKSE